MTDPRPVLVIILGPTATGKTGVAVELARRLETGIISCDSRQFYRELNIGVARPSVEELRSVPHHFIGFLSVTESYNAGRFETDVLNLSEQLFRERKEVIMAGGSGLYIHAVTHGIDRLPDPDATLREQLKEELKTKGPESLRRLLQELDPVYFGQMDGENPRRLLRALEVCLSTGRPFSSLRTGMAVRRPFRVIKIGLQRDRDELYDRINRRVESMMDAGLADEARSLLQYRHLNALNTVGYRELFEYFDGICSLVEAVEKIKRNTRQYAKRQLTWFRRDPEIRWFHPEDMERIFEHISGQGLHM